jgi:hypothetical protein
VSGLLTLTGNLFTGDPLRGLRDSDGELKAEPSLPWLVILCSDKIFKGDSSTPERTRVWRDLEGETFSWSSKDFRFTADPDGEGLAEFWSTVAVNVTASTMY